MMKLSVSALAFLAMSISMLVSCTDGKSSVDIINWSIGEPLFVHCKSNQDDLRLHKLEMKQDYRFEFHESFWDNTWFMCTFSWGPNRKNWQQFLVWDRHAEDPRAMPLDCGNCIWRAESLGMYIWDKYHATYNLWRGWNTNGKPPPIANNITQAIVPRGRELDKPAPSEHEKLETSEILSSFSTQD